MSNALNLTIMTRFIKGFFLNHYIPISSEIAITQRCNFNCTYCDQDRSIPDPSIERIKKIVDRLGEIGVRRISLTGGEPLLRSDLEEILDYIKAKKIKCTVVTNGYLVPEKKYLLDKFSEISISLDGIGVCQGTNRQKKSFPRIEQAIKIIKDKDIPLKLAFVLAKNNATKENIDMIFKYCNENKIYFLIAFVLQDIFFLHSKHKKDIHPLIDHQLFNDIIQYILNNYHKTHYLVCSKKTLIALLNWPTDRKNCLTKKEARLLNYGKYLPHKCVYGKYTIFINHDGSVYPCCLTSGNIGNKNILNDSLQEVLSSVAHHSCAACYDLCYTDTNYMLSLQNVNPSIIFKWLKVLKAG